MDLSKADTAHRDRTRADPTAGPLALRCVTLADLDDVCALLEASDSAVLGHADVTLEDIEAELRRDDLEACGWYAGEDLLGYGWVSREADSNRSRSTCTSIRTMTVASATTCSNISRPGPLPSSPRRGTTRRG